jgi:hypothetical protein
MSILVFGPAKVDSAVFYDRAREGKALIAENRIEQPFRLSCEFLGLGLMEMRQSSRHFAGRRGHA